MFGNKVSEKELVLPLASKFCLCFCSSSFFTIYILIVRKHVKVKLMLHVLYFVGNLTALLEMADAQPAKRKPVFKKVHQLQPDTKGHTLIVKVVDSKMVLQKGRPDGIQVRQMKIAECLVGDETGTIIFTARNEQGSFFAF